MEKLIKLLEQAELSLESGAKPIYVVLYRDFSGTIFDYDNKIISYEGVLLDFNSYEEFEEICKKLEI